VCGTSGPASAGARVRGDLAGAFPAAALPLARAKSRLAAAPAGLSAGEARVSLRAIAVRTTATLLSVRTVTVRLHARVAAEMTVPALADRELRQATFLFLPFNAWKLRPNQRPVNWTFLNLRWWFGWCGALGYSDRFFGGGVFDNWF
jgi:hypothetical protein